MISEFSNVCLRKWKFPKEKVGAIVTTLVNKCGFIPVTRQIILQAMDIMQKYRLQFFDAIAELLELNRQELIVPTLPPGHMHLAEAMKKAAAQFEKKYGSAYVVKVSKNDKESKILSPKLKTVLRGIVEQYEKDGMLPK